MTSARRPAKCRVIWVIVGVLEVLALFTSWNVRIFFFFSAAINVDFKTISIRKNSAFFHNYVTNGFLNKIWIKYEKNMIKIQKKNLNGSTRRTIELMEFPEIKLFNYSWQWIIFNLFLLKFYLHSSELIYFRWIKENWFFWMRLFEDFINFLFDYSKL